MLINPFRPCEGSPTFQEEYRTNYKPKFINSWVGPQIVAPDTPYVAAVGQKQLYFLDTRFDPKTAQHIKEQIERATVAGGPYEATKIDEISATAEVINTQTNETLFVFDPPYARVLFAKGINRRNPALQLPEHEPSGDWLVTYDVGNLLKNGIGYCNPLCKQAVDAPKEDGEDDASYHKRMDDLHRK
ncbi:hypothetical protein CGRA01v4_13462 [Colletotrichum graminicola]|uniref:Ankyrin repeat-containing protein n=1 Tax=Colletotrichum graminicola (strain M1.001 / M2 / FGSC 10212) TaxID=645133 RepID=E3R0C6_COLGM|nr:uncharacterized protein GLRG_11723 [Colletotrichum graminicola M1.001]EFQ36564.1 hypothetical protein GLRG_11723 [Colletotrichum graminicola M1.001]WDK22172.1 hypothetical protein CGRA01v4_13462 [Colletotrichum graminicola]